MPERRRAAAPTLLCDGASRRAALRCLVGLAAGGSVALTACEPAFNWREVQSDDGYRVLFPAKPTAMKRPIDLDGLRIDMAMQFADVGAMSFAVGSAVLPMGALGVPVDSAGGRSVGGGSAVVAPGIQGRATPEQVAGDEAAMVRQRALAAMRAQMVRNIRGRETAASMSAIPVADRGGRGAGSVSAQAIEAEGLLRDERGGSYPVTMLARFAGDGARLFQVVVFGHPLDREQADTFMDSMRLLR